LLRPPRLGKSTLKSQRRRHPLLDEIHRFRPIIEEFLYHAMEDYKIEIRLPERPKPHTITMAIERFTLIVPRRGSACSRRRCARGSASSSGATSTRHPISSGLQHDRRLCRPAS
ncbi:MAG TPA: hypothetical protein VNO75_10650, partial [Gemmatimonadaceae bacterium]|nr:hypothetical protein [Gemmatimonadaceae bacterium]